MIRRNGCGKSEESVMIKKINASIISLFIILIANIYPAYSKKNEVFKLPPPSFRGKLSSL